MGIQVSPFNTTKPKEKIFHGYISQYFCIFKGILYNLENMQNQKLSKRIPRPSLIKYSKQTEVSTSFSDKMKNISLSIGISLNSLFFLVLFMSKLFCLCLFSHWSWASLRILLYSVFQKMYKLKSVLDMHNYWAYSWQRLSFRAVLIYSYPFSFL